MDLKIELAFTLLALFYNLIVFMVYGWDKRAARAGDRRVSEKQLLTLALLGGAPGALLARRMLRHKTRKQPFVRYLMAIAWLNLTAVAALLLYLFLG